MDYQKLKKVLKDEAKKNGGKKGKSKDKKDKKDSKQNGGKKGDGKDGSSSSSSKAAEAAPQAGEKSVLLASPPAPSPPPKPPKAADDEEAAAPKGIPPSKSWLELLSGSGSAPDGAKAADEPVEPAVERVGEARTHRVGVGLVGAGVYTCTPKPDVAARRQGRERAPSLCIVSVWCRCAVVCFCCF